MSFKALLPKPILHGLRPAVNKGRGVARRTLNLRFRWSSKPHIHFLREREQRRFLLFFDWLDLTHPHLSSLFRHTTAADSKWVPLSSTALFVPYLQDPLRERSPELFERVSDFEKVYAQQDVPTVSPVHVLSNSIKSRALTAMAEAGVRVARFMHVNPDTLFDAVADAVGVPFIVKKDQGHGGHVRLVHTPEDLAEVTWDLVPNAIALEFIDTRSPDGLYRKYRSVFSGNIGVPQHLFITRTWNAHSRVRLSEHPYVEEELAFFVAENPFHDQLNEARKALGFDYVAFDFSFDSEGRLVVWEPNPYPVLYSDFGPLPEWADRPSRDEEAHRAQMDRVFGNILRYYLEQAGLSEQMPDSLSA